MDHDQQSRVLPRSIPLAYVAAGAFGLALIIGGAVYFWWSPTQEMSEEDVLTQRVVALQQEVDALKAQRPGAPTTQRRTPLHLTTLFGIPEAGLSVRLPKKYSLEKNNEPNRRGSFVSYDVTQASGTATPKLTEVQFFSEASIQAFAKTCETTLCFEGDVPDLSRYTAQREAFERGEEIPMATRMSFNARTWFATSRPCMGDSCVIREYTTYVGATKVDVWITMRDPSEEQRADRLIAELTIE